MERPGVELSIVMPAYNEATTIRTAIEEAISHVLPVVGGTEIVVVDDGSTDETGQIVAELAASDPRIKYIRQDNAGHGPAVYAGMCAARGAAVLLLDSDCQVALNDFGAHWREFEKAEAVLGVRVPRYDGAHRAALSWFMKRLIGGLFRTSPIDAGTPFKLVKTKHWTVVKDRIGPSNPIPAVLLAIYLVNEIGDVAQRQVMHRPRMGSASSLKPLRLITFCAKGIAAIVRFRFAGSRNQFEPA